VCAARTTSVHCNLLSFYVIPILFYPAGLTGFIGFSCCFLPFQKNGRKLQSARGREWHPVFVLKTAVFRCRPSRRVEVGPVPPKRDGVFAFLPERQEESRLSCKSCLIALIHHQGIIPATAGLPSIAPLRRAQGWLLRRIVHTPQSSLLGALHLGPC
jgi:hypothetical protein